MHLVNCMKYYVMSHAIYFPSPSTHSENSSNITFDLYIPIEYSLRQISVPCTINTLNCTHAHSNSNIACHIKLSNSINFVSLSRMIIYVEILCTKCFQCNHTVYITGKKSHQNTNPKLLLNC